MKHGSFELNEETGMLKGPKEYMEERLDTFLAEVESGTNESLKAVMYCQQATGQHYTDRACMLQAMQLDYAAWHGVRDLAKTAADPLSCPC